MLGLQPSFRFHSLGSSVAPPTLASWPVGRLTRRSVPVATSLTVCASLGKGSRQFLVLRISQPAGIWASSASRRAWRSGVSGSGVGASAEISAAAFSAAGGLPLDRSPLTAGFGGSGLAQATAARATVHRTAKRRSRAVTAFLCLGHSYRWRP